MNSSVDILLQRDADTVNQLLEVWETAVRATHSFLPEGFIDSLKPMVREGVATIEHLLCVRDGEGVIRAFAGVDGEKLEMLFVDASCRGRGIGKMLTLWVVARLNVRYVDVNEQNPQAAGFYERMGFRVFGRSAFDGQGNPFPILHMRLA